MTKSKKNYEQLTKGILTLIRAADLYLVHLLSKHRGKVPSEALIKSIMSGHKVSGYALNGGQYEKCDVEFLEKNGHMKEIGQQIILAIYTSLEVYLTDKFEEFYRYKLKDIDLKIVDESLKRIRVRSLDDIKGIYSQFLDIHIPSFDIEYYTDEISEFQSKYSWDALLLLSKARNEIAHSGTSEIYKIRTLLDVWYPFDFSRRWVSQFDYTFDYFVIEGRKTKLFEHYLENLKHVKKAN